jgi:hypothetical protein
MDMNAARISAPWWIDACETNDTDLAGTSSGAGAALIYRAAAARGRSARTVAAPATIASSLA